MEKFKEKIAALCSEAEIATVRADELEYHIKILETEDIAKENVLNYLENCSKTLEKNLECADEELRNMTRQHKEAESRAEEAIRKVKKLEDDLVAQEEKNRKLFEMYKQSKTDLEEVARSLDEC